MGRDQADQRAGLRGLLPPGLSGLLRARRADRKWAVLPSGIGWGLSVAESGPGGT